MYRTENGKSEVVRQSSTCKSVALLTKPKISCLSWVFGNKKNRRYSSQSNSSVEYYQSCCPRSNQSSRSSSVSRLSRSSSVNHSLRSGSSSVVSRRYSSVRHRDSWRAVQLQQSILQQQPGQRSLLDNLCNLFGSQVSE